MWRARARRWAVATGLIATVAAVASPAPAVSDTTDTTAPIVSINSPSSTPFTTGRPTFSGTRGRLVDTVSGQPDDLPAVSVEIRRASNNKLVQTLGSDPGTGATWTASPTASRPLTPGSYTATAFQSDAAGNVGSSATISFEVRCRPGSCR